MDLQTKGDERDPGSVRRVYHGGVGWPIAIGKEAVLAAIQAGPEAPAQEIARRVGVSARYVRGIRKKRAET